MGKAKIMSYLGDGKYSILYMRDNTRAKQRIAELEKLKIDLDDTYYNKMIDMRYRAQINYDGATQKFFWALDDWANCAKQVPACEQHAALMSAVKDRSKERALAASGLNIINGHIAKNRADHFAAHREIVFLAETGKTTQDGVIMDAWCIDNDPEKVIPNSTEVGTIETFGAVGDAQGGWLPKKYINVQTSRAPEYALTLDHCVKPASSMDAASWAMNYMQWLYVMANNPQYAVGTVTAKSGSSLDVELYGTTPSSSHPDKFPFDGSYKVVLSGTPVDYMTCGASVFEVGDRVIVRFSGTGRSGASVIGFAENPRTCPVSCEYTIDSGTGWYLAGNLSQHIGYGGDTTPVEVVITSDTGAFVQWSDGRKDYPTRTDTNVQEPFSVNAQMTNVTWPPFVSITLWTQSFSSPEAVHLNTDCSGSVTYVVRSTPAIDTQLTQYPLNFNTFSFVYPPLENNAMNSWVLYNYENAWTYYNNVGTINCGYVTIQHVDDRYWYNQTTAHPGTTFDLQTRHYDVSCCPGGGSAATGTYEYVQLAYAEVINSDAPPPYLVIKHNATGAMRKYKKSSSSHLNNGANCVYELDKG